MYNILTRIYQLINIEDKMVEVTNNKKDLAVLNMSEDGAITVYTFSVVVPSLLWGKRTIKSEIAYLPTYGKWRDNIFQTGLVYDLQKMLDPVHRDIKSIIAVQYQRHPYLKGLATDIAIRLVEFVSALVR